MQGNFMSTASGFVASALIFLAVAVAPALAQSSIELDHITVVVSPNAPERAALQRAGFEIAPRVNHNDGQGTASISVEIENSYLELVWPDSTVQHRTSAKDTLK